ncbi:hypothetical protein DevBK_00630 [Devosia sp. BK]|jgi:hypothetical protein|uniref:hypothetical protein n=1 Tax=unclassified Devosia TaxID=196773 RepID=UPI0007148451|nr:MULTISPECIES: hypothetical protein [unclassified Devosia]KQN71554.1 hypothetical protein ASE94_10935 [Devosia sp. Leaf64]KQT45723.1 hypothetical protein ASG47_12265 [Devosia sp. Leaf420]MDV3249824.1 hypothetical protein [Devosia sp. BK]
MRLALGLLFGFFAAISPAFAADTETGGERLFVGKTGIYCVQAPCPWRGIWASAAAQAGPSDLLWAQETLPRIEATTADANRIEEAWASDQCLAILGRLVDGTLQVERIIGDCS